MTTLCATCYNRAYCNIPPDEQPLEYPAHCQDYDESDN